MLTAAQSPCESFVVGWQVRHFNLSGAGSLYETAPKYDGLPPLAVSRSGKTAATFMRHTTHVWCPWQPKKPSLHLHATKAISVGSPSPFLSALLFVCHNMLVFARIGLCRPTQAGMSVQLTPVMQLWSLCLSQPCILFLFHAGHIVN